MQDLEIAKKRLNEKGLTLSIAKNAEVIFETASHGISGFLEAIEKFYDELEGASVADKVAGKAIALLCVYAKVKAVYAVTLSESKHLCSKCIEKFKVKAVYAVTLSERAKVVFEKYAVYHEWSNLVKSILDVDKAKICSFEELAKEIFNPREAYEKLKALQDLLMRDR